MRDWRGVWFFSLGLLCAVPAVARADVRTDDDSRPSARPLPSHAEIPLERARLTSFLADVLRAEQQTRLKESIQGFFAEALRDPLAAWRKNAQLQQDLRKFFAEAELA